MAVEQPAIHFIRQGGGRKKVVFIHGNMGSVRWWQPAMKILADSLDMTAVDLRGFGSSPDGAEDVTLADHAADIYRIIEMLAFSPVTLVGHSLGGAVAMQLAADYPSIVEKMALIDSAPLGGMHDIDYQLLQAVCSNPDLLVASLKGIMAACVDEAYFAALAQDALRGAAAVIPNTRALEKADFSAGAARFGKPVLVVHGERDIVVPVAEAEKLAAAYQGQLTVLAGVGHNPQVENTPEFCRILLDFVNRV